MAASSWSAEGRIATDRGGNEAAGPVACYAADGGGGAPP
jgi:hypothetical protein